jgi:hypothetical protein
MGGGAMGRYRLHGARDEWLGRLMASAAALLAAGGVSTAIGETRSAADAAWTEAVKSDTLEAYAAFAMTFPDSEHAAAAHRQLSGQQWAALDGEAPAGRSLLGYGGGVARNMAVQANIGYADGIRNDNSGRGGNGVYGGMTFVFLH